jgi:predicted  nucleic acid-binding Zn-ribbon protein
MTPEIEGMLKLQSLDIRAGLLQKEIDQLPKHVADIERKLEAHTRKLEVDRAALAANLRDRKSFEDDIKVQNQKISKLREQTLQAKTNEQYRAFQHEIEYCEKEIKGIEDRILERLAAAEPLEKNVKAAEAALDEERKKVEAQKDHARKRTSEDQEFLRQALEEREKVAELVGPKLLSEYTRIRRKWKGGTAIADATDGRCSACQMKLRPQYFQQLRRQDKLMYCESCGRILLYKPPVSLEHEIHQRA